MLAIFAPQIRDCRRRTCFHHPLVVVGARVSPACIHVVPLLQKEMRSEDDLEQQQQQQQQDHRRAVLERHRHQLAILNRRQHPRTLCGPGQDSCGHAGDGSIHPRLALPSVFPKGSQKEQGVFPQSRPRPSLRRVIASNFSSMPHTLPLPIPQYCPLPCTPSIGSALVCLRHAQDHSTRFVLSATFLVFTPLGTFVF